MAYTPEEQAALDKAIDRVKGAINRLDVISWEKAKEDLSALKSEIDAVVWRREEPARRAQREADDAQYYRQLNERRAQEKTGNQYRAIQKEGTALFANLILSDGRPVCPMKGCMEAINPGEGGAPGEFPQENLVELFVHGLLGQPNGLVLTHKKCLEG